jgi:hypothetical protein
MIAHITLLVIALCIAGSLRLTAAPANDLAADWLEHRNRWVLDTPPPGGGPDVFVWTQKGTTDTNLLMSLGFSIISNFAGLVPLPEKAAPPQSLAQLRKCLIGSPKSPADISFWGTNGCSYHISGGFVNSFDCPGSYFHFEDPTRIFKFEGASVLTEKQGVEIASNVVQRLAKATEWWTNGPPRVHRPYRAERIPFFLVEWSDTGTDHRSIELEIDGRTGKVVSFSTTSSIFYDSTFFRAIQSRVYTPEPHKPRDRVNLVEKLHFHQPTTNYVSEAIGNWIVFCAKLGVDPGNQTNLADVDWGRTLLYTNKDLTLAMPVCTVSFTNGTFFQSIGGAAFTHFSADAYYAGDHAQRPREERSQFRGKIRKYEEDLAGNLERTLIERVGIPTAALAVLSPGLGSKRGGWQAQTGRAVGSPGFKRDVLEWRDWPRFAGRAVRTSETKRFFSAEIDLESGELKSISFYDRNLVEAVTHVRLPPPTKEDLRRSAADELNLQAEKLGYFGPTTNDVRTGIQTWLMFCSQLGIDPGNETNLCGVKWEATWFRTNSGPPELQVTFTNGTFFVCRGPTITWFCDHDAFWARMSPEGGWWERPQGLVAKKWDDLAARLERNLIGNVGLEKEALAPFRPSPNPATQPQPGTRGETRVFVEWRKPSVHADPVARVSQLNIAFDTEFDLQSGELKSIHFNDPQLIEALARTRQKTK